MLVDSRMRQCIDHYYLQCNAMIVTFRLNLDTCVLCVLLWVYEYVYGKFLEEILIVLECWRILAV